MEYETIVSAANSIAHKNGVPIDVGMLWARQNIADGAIVITGRGKDISQQLSFHEQKPLMRLCSL